MAKIRLRWRKIISKISNSMKWQQSKIKCVFYQHFTSWFELKLLILFSDSQNVLWSWLILRLRIIQQKHNRDQPSLLTRNSLLGQYLCDQDPASAPTTPTGSPRKGPFTPRRSPFPGPIPFARLTAHHRYWSRDLAVSPQRWVFDIE